MFINNFGIKIHEKWPKLCVKWKKKPFLMKVSPSSLHNHTTNFRTKSKAFENNKKVTKNKICLEENMERKENAAYQHFLFFPQCFQQSSHLKLYEKKVTQR